MGKITPIFAAEKTAAALLDMTPKIFRDLVRKGALPRPIVIGDGVERWCVSALRRIADGTASVPTQPEDFEL